MSAVAILDRHDNHSMLRNKLRQIAAMRGDWAGIPIPLENQRLVIEPSYPYAGLSKIGDEDEDGIKCRNIFWSHRWHCRIAIYEEDGKIKFSPITGTSHSATAILNTIGASFAWGLEQEATAINLIAELLTHVQFKQYMLTGTFIETSKRSGVIYIFRRLRPTIAIRANEGEETRILCTLCMHPIGYYDESWGGCMCPTDDVIAHLMLMRSDEHMFWRRSNQHPPYDPGSGL